MIAFWKIAAFNPPHSPLHLSISSSSISSLTSNVILGHSFDAHRPFLSSLFVWIAHARSKIVAHVQVLMYKNRLSYCHSTGIFCFINCACSCVADRFLYFSLEMDRLKKFRIFQFLTSLCWSSLKICELLACLWNREIIHLILFFQGFKKEKWENGTVGRGELNRTRSDHWK